MHYFPGIISGAHDVNITHCFPEAAQASGWNQIFQPGQPFELSRHLLHYRQCFTDRDTLVFSSECLNVAQDVFCYLIPHTG